MRICYKAGNVTYNTNYYSVITDSVEIRIWFLTDEIIRIRAGFDGDWDEASAVALTCNKLVFLFCTVMCPVFKLHVHAFVVS